VVVVTVVVVVVVAAGGVVAAASTCCLVLALVGAIRADLPAVKSRVGREVPAAPSAYFPARGAPGGIDRKGIERSLRGAASAISEHTS
jgi:hypothetical protein